jgi:hypothetical protein
MTLEITWPPKFVRIRKIGERSDPCALAIAPADYPYGSPTFVGSLPVFYTIDGWLLRPPVVGEPVHVLRFARNDVVWPGLYHSSEVTDVPRAGEFATLNSIYRWEELAELPTE